MEEIGEMEKIYRLFDGNEKNVSITKHTDKQHSVLRLYTEGIKYMKIDPEDNRFDINLQTSTISFKINGGVEVSNGKDTVKVDGKINTLMIKGNTAYIEIKLNEKK